MLQAVDARSDPEERSDGDPASDGGFDPRSVATRLGLDPESSSFGRQVHLDAMAVRVVQIDVCAVSSDRYLVSDRDKVTHTSTGQQSMNVPWSGLEAWRGWFDLPVADTVIMSIRKYTERSTAEFEQLLSDPDGLVFVDLGWLFTR